MTVSNKGGTVEALKKIRQRLRNGLSQVADGADSQ